MIGWNVGKKQPQDRAHRARQQDDQPGFFSQAHDTQPHRDDRGERQGNVHDRGPGHVKRPLADFVKMIVPAANNDSRHH